MFFMLNIFDQLTDLLKKDERLISQGGVLLKNQTQELARKNDPELIKLLLSGKAVKQHFFFEVEKTLIFDKEKFIRFISNKQFLPDSYTAFKNKIGLTVGDEYLSESKEVVLAWPYKDCVLEGGMTKEDRKRDEIFYNETLAPDDINRLLDAKVFTNFKRIDKKGEHKLDGFRRDEKGTIKDNLIIKGNNLLALASLKKEFAGKVKLIYIDPPFAKDADSFYNDSFKRSTWLVFMRNRLNEAYKLLHKDGGIFIHIDDKHQPYLRVLCDEIFGEDNFVNTIVVKSGRDEGVKMTHKEKRLIKFKEYIFFYAKDKKNIQITPQYKEKLQWDNRYDQFLERNDTNNCSKWTIKTINQKLKEVGLDIADEAEIIEWKLNNVENIVQLVGHKSEKIQSTKGKNCIIEIKTPKGLSIFALNGKKLLFASNKIKDIDGEEKLGEYVGDLWTDISYNNLHNEGGVDLPNGKKPEELVSRVIDLLIKKDESEIVLDYHVGCGTTAAVCHKKKIQYIGLEQMDYGENDSVIRLRNVINGDQTGISKVSSWKGGGDFVYMELAKWNEEWIEKIEKAKTGKELSKLWNEMKGTAFLSYKVDPETIDASAKNFAELSVANQKKFLIECLDKNQLYVNLSEIEDKEYGVSREDKGLNKNFYGR